MCSPNEARFMRMWFGQIEPPAGRSIRTSGVYMTEIIHIYRRTSEPTDWLVGMMRNSPGRLQEGA